MREQAEFDVIIYGATGFTGRLVAEYMENQYGRTLNWAMAGRSAEKLAAVRDEIGASAETPLVVADASDPQSVRDMVCLLYTSPSPRDPKTSRMPSSA